MSRCVRMKEVRGTPWSKVIGQKSEAENLAILLAVADAVAFAHNRGVIHRDLKPENIMLGDFGEVLLMDWGLAVSHYPDANGQRVPKGRAGTPAYMAPEMARADEALIGPASDIYLLGAVLYEIVADFPPHTGQNIFACITAAPNNIMRPTDRDGELLAIAGKAMAIRLEDRYATVKDFQAALADYRRHEERLRIAGYAREQLVKARAGGAYEDFNRALFGFDESLALWDGNDGARAGIRETRLAMARTALGHGDSDLALSAAADMEGPVFDGLRADAVRQKREHEARRTRVRRWRLAAAGLVAVVIVVLILSNLLINEERRIAVEQRGIAVAATEKAMSSEKAALNARDEANRSAAVVLAARKTAEEALASAIAAEARETAERAEKEKAKDAELEALRAKEEERKLREDAQSAAKLSEELLTRAGYLENSALWIFDADEARRRQQAAAAAVGRPVRLEVPLPVAGAMVFLGVPPGEFVMGSPTREVGRATDEYLHPVTLTRAFWLGGTPVTRGQWRALVPVESRAGLAVGRRRELLTGDDGSETWMWRTRPVAPEEADLPASGISPNEVRNLFLSRLAALAPPGLSFRLPTEAEWEWACRAGTATPYYTGSTEEDALRAGWLDRNAGAATHPVGQREPNAWGFHDLHGNVHEMVADYYGSVFALTAAATREDPRNDAMPDARPLRVIRGGSHISLATAARSAKRETLHADNRYDDVGVRLLLDERPAAE